MRPRLFQIALGLCGATLFGLRMAAAQVPPTTLHFHLGRFAESGARGRLDSIGRTRQPAPRYVAVAPAVAECPMPVVVPDMAKSERMPVARINSAPYAVREAPVGCVNPLGPKPDSAARRAPTP